MKERPINLSGQAVRAILSGAKTQERRLVNLKNGEYMPPSRRADVNGWMQMLRLCPYGKTGDRIWVRESWRADAGLNGKLAIDFSGWPVRYEADGAVLRHGSFFGGMDGRRRPPAQMPRWASRITLEITGVRVERLQDISEADALAEGIDPNAANSFARVAGITRPNGFAYRDLWNRVNDPDSWDENPWVWVLEFKRVDQP
ncbi:MAG: hypothetical protein K2Q11_02615 [Burkholderiaceae bacterium]|nr:hypothetical protein [Burkholderiaceae bacterium]